MDLAILVGISDVLWQRFLIRAVTSVKKLTINLKGNHMPKVIAPTIEWRVETPLPPEGYVFNFTVDGNLGLSVDKHGRSIKFSLLKKRKTVGTVTDKDFKAATPFLRVSITRAYSVLALMEQLASAFNKRRKRSRKAAIAQFLVRSARNKTKNLQKFIEQAFFEGL